MTMSRTRRLLRLRPLLLVVLLAALGAGIGIDRIASVRRANAQPQPEAKPNIVLLLTDDQRWNTLWAMPNVQRLLADHGVTFRNGFVVNSLCCPSRASILTGRYSHG